MFSSQTAKELLGQEAWEEGKVIPLMEGPYRYRIIVHCSVHGRQKTQFSNGMQNYFSYIELLNNAGQWIESGANMVPVLPDGRFIMVVEQRPAQSRYKTNKKALIQGKTIDLDVFGPHSSLEFPGGAVDPGEGLKAGFLRELQEETGVKEQTALCYQRIAPCNGFGSELALHTHWGVIYLSGLRFEREVDTDGGLSVMALTRGEVQANIWSGVITSGQGGLTCWSFLQEVEQIKEDPELQKYLIDIGYLSVEELQLTNL